MQVRHFPMWITRLIRHFPMQIRHNLLCLIIYWFIIKHLNFSDYFIMTLSKKTKLVVKDNSLINASFNLSLVEQRLILMAIVQAREISNLSSETSIEIRALDYMHQYHVSEATAYETLKAATDALFSRQFSYLDRYKNKKAITKSRWVNKVSYVSDLGSVILNLSTDVISLISRLEEQYTKYLLDRVANFKSKYSIRVYELIIKWAAAGKTEKFELQDLREKLGVEDHEYKQFADFKKRVLESAVKEINKEQDIYVDLEFFKTGRAVTGVRFRIVRNSSNNLNDSCIKNDKIINYKMTPAQIDMFGDKLGNLADFQSKFKAGIGEEMNVYIARIKLKLEDSSYVEKWYEEFLSVVGFKPRITKNKLK